MKNLFYTIFPVIIMLLQPNLSVAMILSDKVAILPEYQYPPVIRSQGYEFSIKNDVDYDEYLRYAQYKGHVTIERDEKEHDFYGRCAMAGLIQQLGIGANGSQVLPVGVSWNLMTELNVVKNCYQQIPAPVEGCLVVYATETRQAKHVGVVKRLIVDKSIELSPENYAKLCVVTSKWGQNPHFINHYLFNMYESYGSIASFYERKEEFKDPSVLLGYLQGLIRQSSLIQKQLDQVGNMIFYLVAGKAVDSLGIPAGSNSSRTNLIIEYFKDYMGLSLDLTNDSNESILMVAVHRKDRQLVDFLLSAGASVNHQDVDGNTALHVATARQDYEPIIRSLLIHGADINIKNKKGQKPFISSSIQQCIDMHKTLLHNFILGKITVFRKPELDQLKTEKEKIMWLLTHDKLVDINYFGGTLRPLKTPLMLAIISQQFDIAHLLLDMNADVLVQDELGGTALYHARYTYNQELIDAIQAKVDQQLSAKA